MKKITLFALLFVGAFSAQAQTEKGNFAIGLHTFDPSGVLGGSQALAPTNGLGVSFGTTKQKRNGVTDEDETKNTSLGLNFNGQYFVIDNLAVGAAVNLFTQTQKEKDSASGEEDKFTVTILMAGPQARYYFGIAPKAKVWVGGNAMFGSAKSKFSGEEEEDEPTKLSQFGGGAGVAFFPNQHFSIDLGLNYLSFKAKSESTFLGTTTKYEDLFSGIALDLGFTAFF